MNEELTERLTEIQKLLELLDLMLTGKGHSGGRQPLEVDFIEGGVEFYLSDGGYSRIVNFGGKRLGLTDNSREAVKARWDLPEVKALRDRAEKIIRWIYQDFA